MTELKALTPEDAARAVPIDPAAPLIIVDVDEVLAHFMAGLEAYVGRQGFEMRIERFALFQNVYPRGSNVSIDADTGRRLFDEFFLHGADDLPVVDGAAAALARLAEQASVIILTNAPDHGREARAGWLAKHGLEYPLIINSGVKGPVVAMLAARTTGPTAFIDDLLPNLESVADDAPDVHRFQMVADDRLRPFAPRLPDRHRWADGWRDLEPALRAALGL